MPAEGWSERAMAYGLPDSFGGCSDQHCQFSGVGGTTWITLDSAGSEAGNIGTEAMTAIFDRVVAAVAAAGEPAPLVRPDRDEPELPDSCDELLPSATVSAVTGIRDPELNGSGGWSDWAEAGAYAGNAVCVWISAAGTDPDSFASVNTVRDGAWAYERMLQAGASTPVRLAGLADDDLATVRCDAAIATSCTVDLVLGPDWLNVAGVDRQQAIALAEAVVAHRSSATS